MTATRVVRKCPACASDKGDAVGHPATSFRCGEDPAFVHPPYAVLECAECGLYYKSVTLADHELGRYYEHLDYQPFNLPDIFPTDQEMLRRLRELPQGSRVLDYGCSTGRLLHALGEGYQRFGVEVNESAAQVARSRGITIVTDAQIDSGEAGEFDAIVLSDVFEHLLQPTETLQRLVARLTSGGALVLVTGLANAARPRELIAEHWYFRIPGHLQMLSWRNLDWLGGKLGLSLDRTRVTGHYGASPFRRLRQSIQLACYRLFREEPASALASLVRRIPVLGRAEQWDNMPATDAFADHVVAILRKPETGICNG
jgi:SAM-dependent methyltransferase